MRDVLEQCYPIKYIDNDAKVFRIIPLLKLDVCEVRDIESLNKT